MNRMKKILSYFVFFLLLLNTFNVFAVQITPQTLSQSLCPRETGVFSHLIKNDQTTIKEYTLNLKGSAALWATLIPKGFILAPGEEKSVFTYVTPYQSSDAGTYDLELTVSSPGDSSSIKHTVLLKDCYGLSLVPENVTINTCPAGNGRYLISLRNTGEYTETLHLSLKGDLVSKLSLSDSVLTLNKKELKNIYVFVTSPKDAGQYSFTLNVDSESGRIKKSLPLFLNVNPCYDFTFKVNANSSYNVCERSLIKVPLYLRNDGTIINTFKIGVTGPVWAKLEERDEYTLKDRESKVFDLLLAPNYGTSGDYAIRVSATPERGDLKAVSDIGITVRKCYSVKVKFLTEKADACKSTNNNYEFLVTNDGEVKKIFRFELDSAPWVTLLGDTSLLLEPGQQKKVFIKAAPTSEVKNIDYTVRVGVASIDETAVVAKDQDAMTLSVKDSETCYKSTIKTDYETLIVYQDSSIIVPLEVRNDGLRKAEFSLLLTGNAATFSTLNPSVLTIEPGKSDTVYVYVAPKPGVKLGKYDAKVNLNLKEGPLLASKDLSIEITDVPARATVINATIKEIVSVVPSFSLRASLKKYKYSILGSLLVILLILFLFQFKKIRSFFTSHKREAKDFIISPSKKKRSKKALDEAENIRDKIDEE